MAEPDPLLNPTTPQVAAPQATPLVAGPDPEIAAMTKVSEALATLQPAVQQRVLRWAADRYNVLLIQQGRKPANGANQNQQQQEEEGQQDVGAPATFTDFAALYDAADPTTEADKALVAGYWVQVIEGNAEWKGFSPSKLLKNLGHGVDNITIALGQLIDSTPRLVMQTHKAGKTKQARKKYKLTNEGIRRVRQMLAGHGGQE